MKKTISKILVLLFVFTLAVACVASCDIINKHTHSFVNGECECGEKDPNYVPPHTHNFVEGKCECGEEDPNYVPPHTHDYKSEETKAPSCTEKGTMTYTCSCGDSYTEAIDMKAHTYVDNYCSVCGQRDPSVAILFYLSADKTQALAGDTVTLSAVLDGKALEDAVYTIVEGGKLASVEGNVLTIGSSAKEGDVIKVQTEYDGVKSNVVSITIIPSTHVDSITAEVGSYSDKIVKGSTVALISKVNPDGIAASFVQWKITEGADYASITGNSLTVSANAETGAIVKVVAYFGEVESNVITLTVTDPAIFSLSLSADKTQAVPGENVTLSALLNGVAIESATYTIIEGEGLATIKGNVLTLSAEAKDGDVIRVKTQHQGVDSNVITVTVIPSTHIDSIYAEVLSSSQNVMKGSTVALKATVNPDGIAASFVQWKITAGADIATISGSSLTISENAETGSVIKVVAYFGDVESNELEITVAATQEEINAGRYFLTVSNNYLSVDKFGASAPSIKVKVLNYNFEEVTLDLDYAIVEGNADLLTLVPNGNTCSFTANGHGTVKVRVSIPNTNVSADIDVDVIVPPTAVTIPEVFAQRRSFNYQFSLVDSLPFAVGVKGTNVCQDVALTFTHESGKTGDEVAVYDYENGMITFKKTGKVTVTVKSASGSKIEASDSYTFDINDGYNAYSHEELYIIGNRNNGYNGDKPINIVVLEKPVDPDGNYQYGYSIVPAVALLPDAEQNVQNIIKGITHESVIDRVSGEVVKNVRIYARIQFVNRGVWLNGNDHSIDASQIRLINKDEYTTWYANLSDTEKTSYLQDTIDISSLFSVETWAADEIVLNADGTIKEVIPGPLTKKGQELSGSTFRVRLYNMEIKGNAPIDHNPGAVDKGGLGFGRSGGGTYIGLSVGTYKYDTHYDLEADNLTVSETELGIWFLGIVGNSTISNLYAYNCYSTGLTLKSCIITLENLKFGPCGACGIELSPEECNKAGEDDNQTQRVTIKGTIDVEGNLNAGNTSYFQNYTLQGATVPQIIAGNLQNYPDIWVSHLRNANGQFNFVSLVFNDFNYITEAGNPNSQFYNKSYVSYPSYQEGGIISIMDLPQDGSEDTTHQFITMPVFAPVEGLGNVQVGTAMFYNMNYGK